MHEFVGEGSWRNQRSVSCLTTPDQGAAANTKFCAVLSSYRCSALNSRQQTPVAKRTVNPVYNPKDATFDFPIYLSLADQLSSSSLSGTKICSERSIPGKLLSHSRTGSPISTAGKTGRSVSTNLGTSLIVCDREFICPYPNYCPSRLPT